LQTTNPVAGVVTPGVATVSFADLGLSQTLLTALVGEGYVTPTPIQQKAIPDILAGRDLLGCAQTGTGKTAAFALPMIERLMASGTPRDAKRPRALVLSPTRELSAQIADSFAVYGRGTPLKYAVIFGGVGHGPQVQALTRGLDVLVATPGRLIDLMNQGAAFLDKVEILVLDEADRMLDMGFLPDMRRILQKLPKQRQTLFFSATMPRDIERLAGEILVNPARVEVTPVASTAELIDQSVYMVEQSEKRRVLERVLRDPGMERAIVFTRTKHGANRLVKELERGEIMAEAIHGNKSQGARQRALDNFKSGRLRVLVATDIAARGIDVDGISHVINFELPNIPESYVHRIGRTARAGATGIAVSLCSREERSFLRDIERLTRTPIRRVETPVLGPEEARPRAAEGAGDRGPAPRQFSDRGPRPSGDRGPAPRPFGDRGPAPRQFGDRGPAPRSNDDRGPAPRPQFNDRGPRPGGDRGPAPRRFDDRAGAPREAAPSRFDGDRGPSNRRFDDSRGAPRPQQSAPRPAGNAAAPRPEGRPSPELYIRRPR